MESARSLVLKLTVFGTRKCKRLSYSYVKPFSLTPNGSAYEMINILISYIVTADWSNINHSKPEKVKACCNSNRDLHDTGAALFAGIRTRCVFNRNNHCIYFLIPGFQFRKFMFCHFIFIFSGYNTIKFTDQLPVAWLADANWLDPCIGIAVRVNPGNPPFFFQAFLRNCKLRL